MTGDEYFNHKFHELFVNSPGSLCRFANSNLHQTVVSAPVSVSDQCLARCSDERERRVFASSQRRFCHQQVFHVCGNAKLSCFLIARDRFDPGRKFQGTGVYLRLVDVPRPGAPRCPSTRSRNAQDWRAGQSDGLCILDNAHARARRLMGEGTDTPLI
jgi:hypothetical protein